MQRTNLVKQHLLTKATDSEEKATNAIEYAKLRAQGVSMVDIHKMIRCGSLKLASTAIN